MGDLEIAPWSYDTWRQENLHKWVSESEQQSVSFASTCLCSCRPCQLLPCFVSRTSNVPSVAPACLIVQAVLQSCLHNKCGSLAVP